MCLLGLEGALTASARRTHRAHAFDTRVSADPSAQRAPHVSAFDAHSALPPQSVAGGYMANAWIRMKHPDYDELRKMLTKVGETVKVRARGA